MLLSELLRRGHERSSAAPPSSRSPSPVGRAQARGACTGDLPDGQRLSPAGSKERAGARATESVETWHRRITGSTEGVARPKLSTYASPRPSTLCSAGVPARPRARAGSIGSLRSASRRQSLKTGAPVASLLEQRSASRRQSLKTGAPVASLLGRDASTRGSKRRAKSDAGLLSDKPGTLSRAKSDAGLLSDKPGTPKVNWGPQGGVLLALPASRPQSRGAIEKVGPGMVPDDAPPSRPQSRGSLEKMGPRVLPDDFRNALSGEVLQHKPPQRRPLVGFSHTAPPILMAKKTRDQPSWPDLSRPASAAGLRPLAATCVESERPLSSATGELLGGELPRRATVASKECVKSSPPAALANDRRRSAPSRSDLSRQSPRVVDDVMEACRLAKEAGIPVATMQEAFCKFKEHATPPAFGDSLIACGRLQKDKFVSLIGKLFETNVEGIESARKAADAAFRRADRDSDGAISFREFATWYSSNSFSEPFSVEPAEQALRKLGKKFNMSAQEIDSYKRRFDVLDADGSGVLEVDEFEELLHQCGKVPRHIRIPQARVQQLWSDADMDGNGYVDFEEFIMFYRKYFKSVGGKSGFELYYKTAK